MECARANVYENLSSRKVSCVAAKLNSWNGVLRYFHWVSCGNVITSTSRSCRTDQYESGKAAIMSPTELIHIWIWFEGITVYLQWLIFRMFPKEWWSNSFYKTQIHPASILQYSNNSSIQLISEDTQPYVTLLVNYSFKLSKQQQIYIHPWTITCKFWIWLKQDYCIIYFKTVGFHKENSFCSPLPLTLMNTCSNNS
jgi:hypothetical protein